MAAAGCTMSLTAPLEVLFAEDIGYGPLLIVGFMLTSSFGVIVIDIFGTHCVPALDARLTLTAALALFGLACIGMAVAWTVPIMMGVRLLQGFGGGMMLGGGLQAAVRVPQGPQGPRNPARALGRFNAAFLFGGAVGSPVGLIIAGVVHGVTGYRIAFGITGTLALLIATGVLFTLPSLAAPAGFDRPRIGLPRFDKVPGTLSALLLAMVGDFLRGGVLFTALPLAGAARGFPILGIGVAIGLMSFVEIVMLTVAYRLLARLGLAGLLLSALGLGLACATVLAVDESPLAYLAVSALFGCVLAGTTIGLPLVVVGLVGDSSAGLARFRISAGLGMLAGSAGCATLGTAVGAAPLFWVVTAVLLGGLALAYDLGRILHVAEPVQDVRRVV
ncbi:MFS transporter [Streptomyces sp. NPDC051976]|uniref:MFS transporter n=1 Tax=Streptomyces sp. NPDC051976 TaxID=3154947 RepID=UPI00341830A4